MSAGVLILIIVVVIAFIIGNMTALLKSGPLKFPEKDVKDSAEKHKQNDAKRDD